MSASIYYGNSAKGVSLMQTVLCIALVGVACIAALQVLSGSVSGGFGSINAGLPTKAAKVPALQDTPQANTSAPGIPTAQVSDINNSVGQFGFVTSVATAIETTGANGTVNGLLANLKAQAEYFKSTGQITPDQYGELMLLVSQGHRMAEAEKAVEIAIANSGNDSSKLASTTVSFEGKNYSVDELRVQFGVDPSWRQPGTLFENFLASKNAVMGKITDPKAKQTMTVLADQVLTVSNSFESSIGFSTLGYEPATDGILKHASSAGSLDELVNSGIVTTAWDAPLPSVPPSALTTANSTAICKVGNGKGAGNCKL